MIITKNMKMMGIDLTGIASISDLNNEDDDARVILNKICVKN